MRAKSHPRPSARDHTIAALAAEQHGIVALWQLEPLGLGRDVVKRAARAGRLHRLYRGVYAVGHRVLNREGRWIAAVLACGPGAVLSHQSSGAGWGIRQSARAKIDVTTVCRGRRQRAGIDLHCVRHLDSADVTELDGIPVTTVPRTLLDLAEVIPLTQLSRAIEIVERLELLDLRTIDDVLARSNGRRGVAALRRALDDHREPSDVHSELERRFLDLCRDATLPLPATNVLVEGFLVDAVWTKHRLVVELDGYEFHRTRDAFERDRRRDAVLALAGYRVVRVTYRMLAREPARVAGTILSLLTRDA